MKQNITFLAILWLGIVAGVLLNAYFVILPQKYHGYEAKECVKEYNEFMTDCCSQKLAEDEWPLYECLDHKVE